MWPYIVQKSHDNNKGDAVFTVFYKYHCKGIAKRHVRQRRWMI